MVLKGIRDLLMTGCKEPNVIESKVGGKRPVGRGAEDELQGGVNPRPILDIDLQRHPTAVGKLAIGPRYRCSEHGLVSDRVDEVDL